MDDDVTTDRDDARDRREAEKLRRDRERAEQQARRDAEQAAARRKRDEQQIERDRARAERDRQKVERDVERARAAAEAEVERRRREVERAAEQAAREAAAASREAAKAAAAAARAEQRAAHQAERAHARARTLDAEPETTAPQLPREVAVLWRTEPPARRGPRPGLTLDDIAETGIVIADAEGIEAVSMGRLAAELGYTAMSLYRYVSSKDEVIALMVDHAVGEPPTLDPSAGWRERLRVVASAQLPVLFAHPWMTTIGSTINTLGPRRMAWVEALIGALDGTRLTGQQKFAIAGALGNQALADVRSVVETTEYARRADARGESGDLDHLIRALVDPAAHPSMAAVLAEGGLDGDAPTDGLTPGLALLLDGVAAWIDRAT